MNNIILCYFPEAREAVHLQLGPINFDSKKKNTNVKSYIF